MKYRPLGRSGIQVSELVLGAMMFGSWGTRDEDEARRVIVRAVEAGINLIDTADTYSDGESERVVGSILQDIGRDNLVLATKFHMPMGPDRNERGNARRWVRRACEASLRRLRTDRIDLYQVHRPDPSCDIDETLGALTDLVREGKVLLIGTSTFPAEQIVEAQWTAERRQRERFRTEQPPYSILSRSVETAVLPTCGRYGMGVITWGPLGGGWLSGRFGSGGANTTLRSERLPDKYDMSLSANQAKLAAVDRLSIIAQEAGISLLELSVAFVLEHPLVSAAIVGPRSTDQLDAYLAAGGRRLDSGILDAIDDAVAPGTDIEPLELGWDRSQLNVELRRRRQDHGREVVLRKAGT
jgi:aryl-alcohol dehydrogenase-like predicted oxidoreductase